MVTAMRETKRQNPLTYTTWDENRREYVDYNGFTALVSQSQLRPGYLVVFVWVVDQQTVWIAESEDALDEIRRYYRDSGHGIRMTSQLLCGTLHS